MKLVYIAGPYRALSHFGVERNILDAQAAALAVIAHGKRIGEDWFPVIPHSMTYGIAQKMPMTDKFWLKGTMTLLRQCDAVAVFGDWHDSEGTRAELREAVSLDLPIYYTSCGTVTEAISTVPFTAKE